MNTEKMAEMYHMVEKAKMFDKLGKEDEALKIYLAIHESYFPNVTMLYERPSIILEKKKRFKEAKAICEKAILLISEGKVTGTVENFQKRLDRINEKIKSEAPEDVSPKRSNKKKFLSFLFETEEQPVSKEIRVPKEVSRHIEDDFKIEDPTPEAQDIATKAKAKFKFKIDYSKIGAVAGISAAILLIAFIVSNAIQPHEPTFTDAYIDTSKMFPKEGNFTGQSIFKENLNPDIPDISINAIDKTIKAMEKTPGVSKAYVYVTKDTISLVIKSSPLISEADGKKIGEAFIDALSFYAARDNGKFRPDNLNNYGKLYTYYNSYIIVKPTLDIIFAEGFLTKNTSKIYWKTIAADTTEK